MIKYNIRVNAFIWDTESPFTRKSFLYKWIKGETKRQTLGFRGVGARELISEWKQGPSVSCLIKCARPHPIGGIQLVPSYFPSTDCRWQSIESLKGSPYSGCLLIRLKGRAEPWKTWKGIWDEGRWCEISEGWKWTLGLIESVSEERRGEEREALGEGGDWEERGWGTEEVAQTSVGQRQQLQFWQGRELFNHFMDE